MMHWSLQVFGIHSVGLKPTFFISSNLTCSAPTKASDNKRERELILDQEMNALC